MWRLIIISCFSAVSTLGDICTLPFKSEYPGIYTQKFGSKNIFLLPEYGQAKFDDGTSLNVYCPGGVEVYNPYDRIYKEVIDIEFTCSGSQLQYYDYDRDNTYNYDRNSDTICRITSQYFEGHVNGCLDQGLVFGFFVKKTPIVIADICYGSDIQRTWFIHYVTGLRSPLVENQQSFNLANLTYPAVDVHIASRLNEEEQSLIEIIGKALPNHDTNNVYKMDNLIPLSSAGYLEIYAKDLESTNSIAWWIPLKYGNWKSLEEAINRLSFNHSLDVYAGFSGHVAYPVNDKCESIDMLSYGNKVFRKNVPLYVWNYIKRIDSAADDKGVVIIGINTPFFDASASDILLCKDICETINWFGYLERTRKMPGLGYIFCCNPSDVKDKLEGFPKI